MDILGSAALENSSKLALSFMRRELVPRQLVALPEVASSPPTATLSAKSGATSIPSSILHASVNYSTGDINPIFRYVGDVRRLGSEYPDSNFVKNMAVHHSANYTGNIIVEFAHHGSKLELVEKGVLGAYRIAFDEGNGYKYVTEVAQAGAPADGSVYLRLIDFKSVKLRNIRVEYSNGYFGGIRIGPNDSITTTSVPPRKKAIWIGDSITEAGSSGGSISHGWGSVASDMLGWDCWNSGVGGTGYINPGVIGRVNFQQRLISDIVQYKPDIVIFAGGVNDESYPESQINDAVRLALTTVRDALPDTEIVVFSNFSPTGYPSPTRLMIRDVLKKNAFVVNASFVDGLVGSTYRSTSEQITSNLGSWITGTGRVGMVQATGNASLFISADGTHPTRDGHYYLGYRMAAEIYKLFS